MIRQVFALITCLLLAHPAGAAQDKPWAVKLFNTVNHDFGTVPKGSKQQYRFQIENIFEQDVRIVSVSSSCQCTTPQLTKNELKSLEKAEIIADFNTLLEHGQKTATLTVKIDKPYKAEVQLHISGFIRGDVVLQPSAVDLGTVDVGKMVERHLKVDYAGHESWQTWKIVDVKTTEPYFEVELNELARANGRVQYDLLVRMTKDAPVGYIKDQLILVTNDARARELPVDMAGRITTSIEISPERLFFGAVQPGETASKKLVVRGKQPFKILDIKCPDKSFTFEPSTEAKTVHLIQVSFTAGSEPGKVSQKVSIVTDQEENVPHAFVADAEVINSNRRVQPASAVQAPGQN